MMRLGDYDSEFDDWFRIRLSSFGHVTREERLALTRLQRCVELGLADTRTNIKALQDSRDMHPAERDDVLRGLKRQQALGTRELASVNKKQVADVIEALPIRGKSSDLGRLLPINVAATNSDYVVNSTRAAFIRLDDDSGHPWTQIPGDFVNEVGIHGGHHRIGAKAGRGAQKCPDRHSWRATQQSDQRSSRCPDSSAKQVAILALEKRYVPTIVLLEHHASLQLEVGHASLLEVLDSARGVVSRIGVIECRDDDPVRHGTLPVGAFLGKV
jgi:hypothetical protein